MCKNKLAIITTHPIQYNAPLFRLLTERANIKIKVFYTWGDAVMEKKFDPGFGREIQWDIPLLEGYEYSFVGNVSKDPGSHHYNGIKNPTIIQEIKAWQANAVLIYGWNFKSHLQIMRYFKGKIPVLFRGDSVMLNKRNGVKKVLRRIFLRWVYRHVDKALYVGTHNKNYFKLAGLKDDQLLFAPHAVNNSWFYKQAIADKNKAIQHRKLLGIPEDAFVFLYAGKLDTNKNTMQLCEAFVASNTNAHLLIAGNGVMENELKKQYGEHINIHFLPFQNQQAMPGLYAMANVFVLPSLSETWGLGINEAMACGLPVIASDACGAAIDLVVEGKTGLTFTSGDGGDLAIKMQQIAQGATPAAVLGNAANELIQEWNFEQTCLQLEAEVLQ